MDKIVIAGGTGFVGQYLSKRFQTLGFQVVVIGRRRGTIQWTDHSSISDALENAAILINLAGKSVNCRYTEKNKAEIFSSRTDTTSILGELIAGCTNPPKLWLNSSTATIYRHAEDRPMTESSGEIGTGFSVDVAMLWEKTFFDFKLPQTRQVALRMAIVLGPDGGVIHPFKNLVRFGLGGIQGNGRQYLAGSISKIFFRSSSSYNAMTTLVVSSIVRLPIRLRIKPLWTPFGRSCIGKLGYLLPNGYWR